MFFTFFNVNIFYFIINCLNFISISKEAQYWVVATIVDVETVDDPWYLACKRCSKKLVFGDSNSTVIVVYREVFQNL